MESQHHDSADTPSRALFDYSEVVTMVVGKGSTKHYFAFDLPRLGSGSTYFDKRLHGDHQEAREHHIKFGNIDPRTVACMLYWFRGWNCPFCDVDSHHIIDAYALGHKYSVPRFMSHLVQKMQTLLANHVPTAAGLGCIVHLSRVVGDDCDLLDCITRHIFASRGNPLLTWVPQAEPASLKHLNDLLTLEGGKVSELKALLGLGDRRNTRLSSKSKVRIPSVLCQHHFPSRNTLTPACSGAEVVAKRDDSLDYDLSILGLDN